MHQLKYHLSVQLGTICVLTFSSLLISSLLLSFFFPQATDPSNVTALLWSNVFLSLSSFALPALLFLLWQRNDTPDAPAPSLLQCAKANRLPSLFMLILAAAAILFTQPLSNFTALINEQLTLPDALSPIEQWMRQAEDEADATTLQLLDIRGGQSFGLILLALAVIPAISEELLFRAAIQPLFTSRLGIHAGVWLTAAIFSFFHFQFFGFLPRLLLGAILGYLFVFTGNIWTNIFAHFINNALVVTVAIILQLFYGFDVLSASNEVDTLGLDPDFDIFFAIVSAAMVTIILLITKAHYARTNNPQP